MSTFHRTVMGVMGASPEETNAKIGADPRTPVPLLAWSRAGRFWLVGVRAMTRKGDDLHLRILHPRTREPLFEGDAWRLNPDEEDSDVAMCDGLFAILTAPHVEGEREPVYCTEQEPLVIWAVGSVPVNLVVFGDQLDPK